MATFRLGRLCVKIAANTETEKLMKRIVASAGLLAASCAFAVDTVVDEVEVVADTNIVVAAGDTLRIDYLRASAPHTVTKTGVGKLVLTVVGGGDNITVDVQEGTLASARQLVSPKFADNPHSAHIDCNDRSTMSIDKSTGKVDAIKDVDTGVKKCGNWWMGLPHITDETLNGLNLLDFGALSGNGVQTGDDAGMLSLSAGLTREFIYVWRDRDDAIDYDNGGTAFNGPCVLGNNSSFYNRSSGGNGLGFAPYSYGVYQKMKDNVYVDGVRVPFWGVEDHDRELRVGRGFHLLHNSIAADKTAELVETLGYSYPQKGGIVLAEVICYSNLLSAAQSARIDAYLTAKWFGAKLGSVTLSAGATLDVSAVPLKIGQLDAGNGGKIVGWTNLVYETVCGTATVGAGDTYVSAGTSGEAPDLAFETEARLTVEETNRVGNVTAEVDKLTKAGDGELIVADPDDLSVIKVDGGTLMVSPLHVKGAEYHVDATRTDTITTAEENGKDLITEWRDVDRTDRKLTPTTWRKPQFDTSHLVRKPFLTENALAGKPMVDFGTFADANHPDGWGAEICPNKTFNDSNGLREIFAVWQDYPELKNEPYFYPDTKFCGPSLFGMQYHWYRGKGGNGESFPMHYEGAPGCMYGDMRVDGAVVNAQTTRIGDGIHVLAQRIKSPGAPFEELGGNYQTGAKKPDGTTVQGVYGGLMIGEVLMFKEPISDTKRSRIEGALRGKWTGAVNEWSYDSLDVAAGATFKQPYTDLRVGTVALAGTVVASSLRAETLTYSGDAAAIDGALELADGGAIEIQSDGAGGFRMLTASSVSVSGKGTIRFAVRPDDSLLGQEIKLVDSASVTLGSSGWKSTLADLPTMRAYFVAKEDGLYVGFRPTGMMLIFR